MNDPPGLPGFIKLLREMKVAYDRAADPHEKRNLWGWQLELAIELIRQFDLDAEGLALPLRDLSLALLSLDIGATEPALQPRKTKGGRPPQLIREAMFRGHVAAASAALRRVGFDAPVADAHVAKQLDKRGYRNGGLITGATIAGWRKEAREASPSDPMRFAYDHLLQRDQLDNLVEKLSGLFDWSEVPPRMMDWEVRGFLESMAIIKILGFHFPPSAFNTN
jgi:hypothetical protein